MVRRAGAFGRRALTPADLAGLPMPENVYNDTMKI
jgi:hypothetical protein